MTSSQVFESPQHIQYFLAILQGYSSRIMMHQESAKSLSEENQKLREKAEEIRRQNRDSSSGLDMQNKLIRCQEEHISLLESFRKNSVPYQPLNNWSLPESSVANWQVVETATEGRGTAEYESTKLLQEMNVSQTKKRKLDQMTDW